MKKKIARVVAGILVFFVIVMAWKIVSNTIWFVKDLSNPEMIKKIQVEYSKKTDKQLLGHLKSGNYAIVGIAAGVLSQRGVKEVVPVLQKLTKSDNEQIRITAFLNLGKYKNDDVISFLNGIVNNPDDKNYINALNALSMMKYEPVYDLVVDLATSQKKEKLYAKRAYALSMLKNYGNEPAKAIISKIAMSDDDYYVKERASEILKEFDEIDKAQK